MATNVAAESTRSRLSGGNGGDLRDWLRGADELGQLQTVRGADWDLEIGGITELVMRQSKPSCLLFDEIRGHAKGWRLVTNAFTSKELAARLLGLPDGLGPWEMTQAWREKTRHMPLIPVREVSDGPLMQNVYRGADIDLERFPTPRWHEKDGGRYLGTADMVVTRDPEDGQINVGAYRMMLQGKDKVGLYISPGHHGRLHRDKYFSRGEPMPVVAVFGAHPLLHLAASRGLPPYVNEYEWAGGVRGQAIDVIPGPITGLPMPADAEIVVEGFLHPDRLMDEGPFGEWTGYYASAVRKEPYVQVEAIYHRDDPIILGHCPGRPPHQTHIASSTILQATIMDALEAAGIPDVKAVACSPTASRGFLVVSIKPRYSGHAKQVGFVASQCRGGAYLGRYVVVVDEDIDPFNTDDVIWAIWSRSEPAESLDVIHNAWSTPLDPRISPDKRAKGEYSNSRLIIDATRPYSWRSQFPEPTGASPQLQAQLRAKWQDLLA